MIRRWEGLLLGLILGAAVMVRLYKIDNPIADWHSWRQADTAAVTRNFLKHGVDVWHPKYDDISNIQTGKENPEGYRMVEFPIYNLLHLVMYKLYPRMGFEVAGRLTSILASVMSIGIVHGIVRRYSGKGTALLASGVLTVLPYTVYYSRVILPDPMMVTFGLGSVWMLIMTMDRWPEKVMFKKIPWNYLALSAGLGAVALLLKPTGAFLLAVGLYPVGKRLGFQIRSWLWMGLWGVVVISPLWGWRQWISNFPEGIPAYSWLLDGDNLRWRPAWWRWLFFERIGVLMLGGFGLIPLALGVMRKVDGEDQGIYIWWWVMMFVYLSIFATGNVRHDYYQVMLMPIISVSVAQGLKWMWIGKQFNRWLSIPLSAGIIGMMLFISWYTVRGYYQINNPAIVEAGRWADQVLPVEARVIAPYQGDTAFLYQINRPGWPVVTNDIESMKKLGATHYVSVNYDEQTKKLERLYAVQTKTDKFVIIDLTEPRELYQTHLKMQGKD